MEMQITLMTEGRDGTSLEYQARIRLIQKKNKEKSNELYQRIENIFFIYFRFCFSYIYS